MLITNALLAFIGAMMAIVGESVVARVAGGALVVTGTAAVWIALRKRRSAE